MEGRLPAAGSIHRPAATKARVQEHPRIEAAGLQYVTEEIHTTILDHISGLSDIFTGFFSIVSLLFHDYHFAMRHSQPTKEIT
jgi:hypothetical protein